MSKLVGVQLHVYVFHVIFKEMINLPTMILTSNEVEIILRDYIKERFGRMPKHTKKVCDLDFGGYEFIFDDINMLGILGDD